MFLYYLAAIGSPDMGKKVKILLDNLQSLYKNLQSSFDIMVNCYDIENKTLEPMLKSLPFLKNIYFYKKKGRLVELWKTNPYHSNLSKYMYILYILDDVKIDKLNLLELVSIKRLYEIEFLSPKVVGGTWDYMRNQPSNTLALANNIELFCLLLTSNDFNKLMEINDIENAYTWGVDLLLGHFQIKSAIYFNNCVTHCLSTNTDRKIAADQMHDYIRKHGYKTVDEIREKYPAIYKVISL